MKKILLLIALLAPISSIAKGPTLQITPQPREVKLAKGCFNVRGIGFNYDSSLEERTIKAIGMLADDVSAATGKVSSVAIALNQSN